jgi:photosystem II stability/assembly factor-like uncharacterized protein
LLLALFACNGSEPVDTGDTDTGGGEETDTDKEIPVQFVDRTIETSTTLNDVYSGGQGAYVFGEDGKVWSLAQGQATPIPSGVESRLTGAWGRGDGGGVEMIAVGYAGAVLEWNGAAFQAMPGTPLGTTNFEDIDGNGSDLTAVSATGIYRWNGTAWDFESTAFNRSIRAVYVGPDGSAWAVGDQGTIIRREGTTWTQLPAPSGVDLKDVHGAGSEVLIVGNRGTFLRWVDGAFKAYDAGTNVNFAGVWVASTGKAFLVGNTGTALLWDPEAPGVDDDTDDTDVPEPGAFQVLPTGSDANLYAVRGTGEDNVWVVGNRGAVFRYTGPVE